MTRKRGRITARTNNERPGKKVKLMENMSNQEKSDEEEQRDHETDTQERMTRHRAIKERLKVKIEPPRSPRLKRKIALRKLTAGKSDEPEDHASSQAATGSSSPRVTTYVTLRKDTAGKSDETSTPTVTDSEVVENLQFKTFLVSSEESDSPSNEAAPQFTKDAVMEIIVGNQNQQLSVPDNKKEEPLGALLLGFEGDTSIEVLQNSIVLYIDNTQKYVVLPQCSVVDEVENVNSKNDGNIENQVMEREENQSLANEDIKNRAAENEENQNPVDQDMENVGDANVQRIENDKSLSVQVAEDEDRENMENQDIHNILPVDNPNERNIQDKNVRADSPFPEKYKDEITMKAVKKLKQLPARKTKVKSMVLFKAKEKSKRHITQSVTNEVELVSPLIQHTVKEDDEIECNMCEQRIENGLDYHNNEPIGGFEESAAILDSRLLLFDGDGADVSTDDTRSYNKITSFSVYCKNGHLCHFDSGLIEKDMEIYFSGYLKPIHSDDPSPEDGVPGKRFGPINWWWMTGFDIGEQPTVGFTTELGDYICMEPSAEYAPFMRSVQMKIYISKIVIEFLIYEPNASYEDLLGKLQTTPVVNDLMENFTEDTLLHYAPFICRQVVTFDDTAKPKEKLMVTAPCIRRLIDLAGIRFEVDTSTPPPKNTQIFRERQFEHKIDYREKLLRQVAEYKTENSGASELIDILLPIHEKPLTPCIVKPWRCGVCERCLRDRCRECKACHVRNYESCYQRRCFNREIMEENEEDAQDEIAFSDFLKPSHNASLVDSKKIKVEDSFTLYRDSVKPLTQHAYEIEWATKPLFQDVKRTYYGSIYVNYQLISPGDFIDVRSANPGVPPQIMKVAYMYEDSEKGLPRIHACFFWSGKYTVLGDISDGKELFFINRCIDINAACIVKKVRVLERTTANLDNSMLDDQLEYPYVCQRSYNPLSGTFHDLQPHDNESRGKYGAPYRYCWVCDRSNIERTKDVPIPCNKIEEKENRTMYEKVRYKNEDYPVGSAVYLKSQSLYFTYPMHNKQGRGQIFSKQVDEEKYSELYRKDKENDAKRNHDVPAPFNIGYITKVFADNENRLFIKMIKLYRPENTHKGEKLSKDADVNKLFWSDEDKVLPFSYVIGKCYIAHLTSIDSADEWSRQGPDRFYFSEIYRDGKFDNIHMGEYGCPLVLCDAPVYHNVKLKSLNIFAGCGGLSLGLRQAGAAECKWAIEPDEAAAATFKLNNSESTIFVDTCVEIMEKISKKDFKVNGQRLPKKGDVDLLCATLPSESWRSINTVHAFKSSNISTFLVYLEFYQPPFFVLEADDILLKRSIVLKLAIASFIRLGYQVAFDLVQVANYGAPQNRLRLVIVGAARGQTLPDCPKSRHVFSKSSCHACIGVDNKMYQRRNWTESAPYRATTVRDAILDLSALDVSKAEDISKYNTQSLSFYQRMMRHDLTEWQKTKVFNHVDKDLGALVHGRMSNIPTPAGSDWRDLPNIEFRLRDKTFTKKLKYSYADPELGRGKGNQPRGVCSCSVGKACEPSDVQENTLIPWHLVHSGKRHGHWAGLYGKLQWDGVFVGTWTNPEPLAKKAPVIHPSQGRILSVRECARAQGFPDSFIFAEGFPVHSLYKQIGLSTCPLLARAIGYEIAKSAASAVNVAR